jgi:hypothetical protein
MKLKGEWKVVLRPVQILRSIMYAYGVGDQEEMKRRNRKDDLMQRRMKRSHITVRASSVRFVLRL